MAELAEIEAELAVVAAGFDADLLLGSEAARVVEVATRIVNLAGAIKVKAAARVAATPVWKHQGFRSPADWLAGRTKSSVGEAIGWLETGERLEGCPAVAERLACGALTVEQGRVLVRAVAVDPDAEAVLLRVAEVDGFEKLAQRCREVEHRREDPEARQARLHRSRSVRHWTGDDGAFCLSGRLTPEAGATVLGALAPFERAAFEAARRDGRREPHEAYVADALVGLARASLAGADVGAGRPVSRKASFTVLVDLQALLRGRVEGGETCEIPGVGPVAVSRLYELAPAAFWHVLVTNGRDIRGYCAMSRYIPTMLRVALAARDRECAVAGCNRSDGLEIDHIVAVEDHGPTTYENLRRVCYFDHRENKHRRGLTLETDEERGPP